MDNFWNGFEKRAYILHKGKDSPHYQMVVTVVGDSPRNSPTKDQASEYSAYRKAKPGTPEHSSFEDKYMPKGDQPKKGFFNKLLRRTEHRRPSTAIHRGER